jgi:uncharacterized protein (TIGR01244 family)
MRLLSSFVGVLVVGASVAAAPAQAQVTKPEVPGVRNFSQVQTTVACAGAIKTDAVPELKKMGFKSIINLRLASEEGADVDAEAAAAKAAGVNYAHIPFAGATADPAIVDTFLAAVTNPANEPAFIHCASGNRAAAMWMIKRVQVDKWDVAKAGDEAAGLGLTNPQLKQFALNYIDAHKK